MIEYSLRNEKSRLIREMATSLHGHITELFENGYDQGYEDGKNASCEYNMECEYIRGLNEAWEAAKKLVHPVNGGYTGAEKKIIFDNSTSDSILLNYTASEAIAKIKAYEKQQKQDAEQKQDTEIKVGDEVITEFGYKGVVITNVPCKDGNICVWSPTCTHVQMYPIKNLTKTGRHFPQIAEVMTELRGESE